MSRAFWRALGLAGAVAVATSAGAQQPPGARGEPVAPVRPVADMASSAFVGQVRAVTPGEVQVVDPSGRRYVLVVDARTRAFGGDGQPLAVEALREGTRVQTSLVLVSGRNHAWELRVVDPAELQRAWDVRRQPRW